ncbi:nucleoside deaminase [Oenococcus alcoholitolerans]
MDLAIERADENLLLKEGGPFGAVVVRNEEIIAAAHNRVLIDRDPTAHAEIVAIRKACKVLGTHDLSGCRIYTNCYPCPMCLSAIIWANIKEVFYANSSEDASKIGFRDDSIYKFIAEPSKNEKIVKFQQQDHTRGLSTFAKFAADQGQEIY